MVGFYPAHTEPEEKLKILDKAIEKFRGALTLAASKTDAQFNLAQALHLRSEILQDTTEVDNSYMQSAMGMVLFQFFGLRENNREFGNILI